MLILRIYLTLTYFYAIIVLKIRIFQKTLKTEKYKVAEVGLLKEIDKLGRIVIQKELRERYIMEGRVEIIATREGILIKNPEYVMVKRKDGKIF